MDLTSPTIARSFASEEPALDIACPGRVSRARVLAPHLAASPDMRALPSVYVAQSFVHA